MDCNTTYLRNNFNMFIFFRSFHVLLYFCYVRFLLMSEINVINDFAHQQFVLLLILLVPS